MRWLKPVGMVLWAVIFLCARSTSAQDAKSFDASTLMIVDVH